MKEREKLFVLQIEHSVQDSGSWEKAFDSDLSGNHPTGALAYRLSGVINDPNKLTIDMEFDDYEKAELVLVRLRGLWAAIDGKHIKNRQVRLVEVLETRQINY